MIEIVKMCEAKTAGALEASRVLLAAWPNNLINIFEAEGFNDSASTTLYWQLHGGTAAPAAAAVPVHSIRVPAGQSFYWQPLGGFAIGVAGGIWVSSTTPATYTAGAASFWALVRFMPELSAPT